uniref:Tfp pilus assembly protein n=1 Tax=Tetraselmis sp. GSL018 TaxID=582737 RepID=A0A061SGR3_9CHLO|mmetsp:Transcript_36378/g.86380  ORF Transcript_36378/g.86380 Transcript_36378/m.86380 type:complete len:615 (-) Transcript_36378:958-2802(-)
MPSLGGLLHHCFGLNQHFPRKRDFKRSATESGAHELTAAQLAACEAGEGEPSLVRRVPRSNSNLSLSHYERLPGIKDARALNNLGSELLAEGDVLGAEPLFRQALQIAEDTLGLQNRDTAICLSNLADLLVQKGDLKAGEEMHRKALEIKEEMLGPDHPGTATSYSNLAGLLQLKGDTKAAQDLYLKALAVKRHVLGPKHKSTATTLNNLAALLYSRGDLDGAEGYLREALDAIEDALGSKHPDTAICYTNLSNLLMEKGQYDQAEPLLQQALTIRREVLGESHPDTRSSFSSAKLLSRAKTEMRMSSSSFASGGAPPAGSGVSVRWLIRFFQQLKASGPDWQSMTARDIAERVVAPATAGSRARSFLQAKGAHGTPPQFVLCHSWDRPFSEVVDCLRRRFEFCEGTVVWLGLLSLGLAAGDAEANLAAAWEQAERTEGTLVVVDPAGACFRDPRCLFQVGAAAAARDSRVEMLPYLLDVGDSPALAGAVAGARIADAAFESAAEREAMLAHVRRTCGEDECDRACAGAVVRGVGGIVAYILGCTSASADRRAELAASVGHALAAAGHPAAAEPLLRRALEILEGAHGEEHPDVAAVRRNLQQALAGPAPAADG